MIKKLIHQAVAIQQIPAPTFMEEQRGDYMLQQFKHEGLAELEKDEVGNVLGLLPGSESVQPIVVSAHLDTVFPLDTILDLTRTRDRITGPGIGDNSIGLASLLGLAWLLKKDIGLKNDLWLIANVGEEGLGDLRGMKAVVDRFGDKPKAYIILEGMALGSIYHRGLGVRRYSIQVYTEGGHSWVNFGRPSAIHELARFITRLESLNVSPFSAQMNSTLPKASYNVGKIQGGISVNTIAAQAEMVLDLRSESGAFLQELADQVEKMIMDENQRGGKAVNFSFEIVGERPFGEIGKEHPLVELAQSALKSQAVSPRIDIGSTDANIPLSKGYPAVTIGITNGAGAHTMSEHIEIKPISKGMAQLVELVRIVDQLL